MTLYEYQKMPKDSYGRSRLYRIWDDMIGRCYRPGKGKIYARYGGRGITVCEEWKNSFPAFRDWALKNGYNDSLEIDRIDNELGYSPDNCRFVTHRVNNRNRRNCRMILYLGKCQCMSAWAEELGINYSTMRSRFKNDWSVERALSGKGTANGIQEA